LKKAVTGRGMILPITEEWPDMKGTAWRDGQKSGFLRRK
jgi:hypothetical protein